MEDEDFEAYIGSEASEDEGEDAAKLLRKALLGSDAGDTSDEDETKANPGGMEMTFMPDLGKDMLSRKAAKEADDEMTPWEKYQKEKAMAKLAKRKDKRQKKRDEEREQTQTLSLSKKKLLEKNKPTAEDEDRLAEMFPEEEGPERDFNMNEIVRQDKMADKNLKGKRKKKEERRSLKVGGLQEGFAVNVDDARFESLYEKNADFAIDPTDARFKKTQGMESILNERRGRRDGGEGITDEVVDNAASSKSQLQSLVASVKRKLPRKNRSIVAKTQKTK